MWEEKLPVDLYLYVFLYLKINTKFKKAETRYSNMKCYREE